MFLAIVSTSHFDFAALGTDEAHARRVLTKAWNKHARQTGASASAAEILEDANFVEIEPGAAMLDFSTVIVKGVE